MAKPDSKFIELHHLCGKRFLINIETIDTVSEEETGTRLATIGAENDYIVRQTYDEIKAALEAQPIGKQDDHPPQQFFHD